MWKDTVDFLEGLKSALRQDPDVIMIGEIRDKRLLKLLSLHLKQGILYYLRFIHLNHLRQ